MRIHLTMHNYAAISLKIGICYQGPGRCQEDEIERVESPGSIHQHTTNSEKYIGNSKHVKCNSRYRHANTDCLAMYYFVTV